MLNILKLSRINKQDNFNLGANQRIDTVMGNFAAIYKFYIYK